VKSISRLKDEARRFEQQEQWAKAITAYLQVLQISEAGGVEVELPLYNRIGDLCVRLGRADEAVNYYEQSADRYADIGLYNNAIALCNKALRYRPERFELMKKLGQFSLQQGFLTDATRYYVGYAEKRFAAGQVDEAFAALEEFASTSNDPEVRELLGRRLQSLDRTERAVKELLKARELRMASGDVAGAAAVLEEVRALDPSAAVAAETGQWQEAAATVLPTEPDESGMAGTVVAPLPMREDPAADDVAAEPAHRGASDAGADRAADEAGRDPAAAADRAAAAGSPAGGWIEGFQSTAAGVDPADPAVPVRARIETEEVTADDVDTAPLEELEPTGADFETAAEDLEAVERGYEVEGDSRSFVEADFEDDPEGFAEDDASFDEPYGGLPLLEGTEFDDFDDRGEPLPLLGADAGVMDAEPAEAAPDFDGDIVRLPEMGEESGPVIEAVDLEVEARAAAAAREELQSEVASAGEESAPAEVAAPDRGYIDLANLLAEAVEETTRFRVTETAPSGDEDRDFAELLSQFKAKLSAHLPPEDAAAHYDLGLAFREMGLIDEAITEFQIAARAGHMRLKVFEELGQCFLEKRQYNIAEKVLRRALDLGHRDELELLGVYYHLGRACEALGRHDQARDAYERVLGMDINFQDVTERLARL
jgi:tetratricopeptide (TPR) repeat protein